jgi:hypothetical protein
MTQTRLEREFQATLIEDLRLLFPGCIIQKLNSGYQQGIPDLLILWNDRWATLECKKSANETPRPNQPHFVAVMNEMSFSSFIYPENRQEVLDALERTLRSSR